MPRDSFERLRPVAYVSESDLPHRIFTNVKAGRLGEELRKLRHAQVVVFFLLGFRSILTICWLLTMEAGKNEGAEGTTMSG
jgi:hypothetical protein